MKLEEGIEIFKKHLVNMEKSKETIRAYSKDITLFSRFLFNKYNSHLNINQITTEDIEEYLYYTLTEKNYASATRRRIVISLKSFFTFCTRRNYCLENITNDIEYIKIQPNERTYLTDKEVSLLISSTRLPLLQCIIQTLYYTGLRVSELVNLTLDSVDLKVNIIHVLNGKGNKDRKVPISRKLKSFLMEYLHNCRNDAVSTKFFCTKTGSISPSYINRTLKISAECARIDKHVTAHVLRHSFASSLLKKRVDIVKIQRLLGHSSIKTTCIYTH